MADPLEDAALAAEVERSTGLHIGRVEHVTLLPLARGKCAKCGVAIEFLNVMLCEACLPPAPTCAFCGGLAECFSSSRPEGQRHVCADHARSEWGWG